MIFHVPWHSVPLRSSLPTCTYIHLHMGMKSWKVTGDHHPISMDLHGSKSLEITMTNQIPSKLTVCHLSPFFHYVAQFCIFIHLPSSLKYVLQILVRSKCHLMLYNHFIIHIGPFSDSHTVSKSFPGDMAAHSHPSWRRQPRPGTVGTRHGNT